MTVAPDTRIGPHEVVALLGKTFGPYQVVAKLGEGGPSPLAAGSGIPRATAWSAEASRGFDRAR